MVGRLGWGKSLQARTVGSVAALALLAGCEQKNAYVPPPPPKVTVASPVSARSSITWKPPATPPRLTPPTWSRASTASSKASITRTAIW